MFRRKKRAEGSGEELRNVLIALFRFCSTRRAAVVSVSCNVSNWLLARRFQIEFRCFSGESRRDVRISQFMTRHPLTHASGPCLCVKKCPRDMQKRRQIKGMNQRISGFESDWTSGRDAEKQESVSGN